MIHDIWIHIIQMFRHIIINQFSKVLNYGYDHKPSKVRGYDTLRPSNEIHIY